jgi:taurine dioxygenase
MSPFTIRPLTVRIGAEILGIDCRKISDSLAQALREAFAQYQVLVIRDQKLSPEELIAFGKVFGELESAPMAFKMVFQDRLDPFTQNAVTKFPEIMPIHADAQSKWVAGEGWHTDNSWDPEPAIATILNLHTIPEIGGDTLFSSMSEAYKALSPAMQAFLAPLKAIHAGGPGVAKATKAANDEAAAKNFQGTIPTSTHPLVRTHPVTGKKGIYFNQNLVTEIVGLKPAESRLICSFLDQHIAHPNFQCRVNWAKDSMVIWDNCAVQHLAIWDYFPNVRTGLRMNVKGSACI